MKPLQLELKTYFDTGNAINQCCIKVMPLEPKKKLQKFTVGTAQNLLYWEFKKGELVQDFKSEAQAKEISRVVISGIPSKFSVFFAGGQSIRGVTKKGKEFFKLDTSHTEVIKSLHVQAQSLWSAGEYILNCYESVNNKIVDKYFFISEDKINDMVIASVSGQMVHNPVLACQDKTLKVLVDEKILYQHKFESACTAISLSSEQTHRYCPVVGYGLRNGGIGCIELTRDEPVSLWSLEGSQTNGSAVAIVKTCNLNNDGYLTFIAARDDGSIEIYSYEHKSPIPILRFETKIQESITGIDAGFITSAAKQEVLISTYSGKVLSLVDSKNYKGDLVQNDASAEQQKVSLALVKKEKQEKISNLQREVQQLKQKAQEIDKIEKQELFEEIEVRGGDQSIPIDIGDSFKVSYKLNIIPQEAAYSLFIDSQLPIDCLMLQSMQNIDILDVKDNICKINKIVDKLSSNVLLATLKVQGEESNHSRVEIKIRTSEGQMGNLVVFVMPKPSSGNKTCQVLDVPLKPLNLHERIDIIDEQELQVLSFSKIKITGKFSLSDAQSWISNCLPDVPPNVSSEGTHKYYYKSTFIGTFIVLELNKEEISIQSDNVSVITIIKDQATYDATQKKIALEIESNIQDHSWKRTLELLNPLIQEQYTIAQKNQLIDGLKELQLQEEDTSFLSDEYKEILRNADAIRSQFKMQPRKLTYLWGIIADLYMDTAKIKGHHNVQNKMSTLKQILNQYNYVELVEFFKHSW